MMLAKPEENKIHILIMDDSIGTYMSATGIDIEHLLDGTGLNVEVKLAESSDMARLILDGWVQQGIKPDIVCTDVLYGYLGHIGIQQLDFIMDDIYAEKPELKPTKIFVHSKSGINEGDREYATARHYIEELSAEYGAEYMHTDELFAVGDKFGSDRDYPEDYRSPTTNTFRRYLLETFGIEMSIVTRDEIEENQRKQAAANIGDNIEPYDALEAVYAGGITPQQALLKMSPDLLKTSLQPKLNNYSADGRTIDYHFIDFSKATGGAANGVAAFTAEEVRQYKAEGKKVILVLQDFTPADVRLLANIDGVVLLGRGSSHLPILCDNHGIPGIFSQEKTHWGGKEKPLSIQQDEKGYKLVSHIPSAPNESERSRESELYDFTIRSGDPIALGATLWDKGSYDEILVGEFYRQHIPVEEKTIDRAWWIPEPMKWARAESTQEWHRPGNHFCHGLAIKANADSAEQVRTAFATGAQGIGLLRTEHMLMKSERLQVLQTYILSDDPAIKKQALAKLKAFQKEEFAAIYAEVKVAEANNYDDKTSPMKLTNLLALPVTVRLFDIKADELLPKPDNAEDIARLMEATGLSEDAIKAKIIAMIKQDERGVQFGLNNKDLYAAQAEAIFEAAKEADAKEQGHHKIKPEIMVPMVRTTQELIAVKEIVDSAAEKAGFVNTEDKKAYQFGTMIETREAIINASSLAQHSDFFSFGTNDLTQELLGISRDDIEGVDRWMNENRAPNPFGTLDQLVQSNIQMATVAGLRANKLLKIGVCGAQVASDQPSIAFCQTQNLDSISVPSNFLSLVTSSIIAGQEALKSHQEAKAASAAKKASGIRTLADEGAKRYITAIDPENLKARGARKWVRE